MKQTHVYVINHLLQVLAEVNNYLAYSTQLHYKSKYRDLHEPLLSDAAD